MGYKHIDTIHDVIEETSAQERVGNSSILRNISDRSENYYSTASNSSNEMARTTAVSWADIVTGKGT